MQKQTLVRCVAPLVALGLLAFGPAALGADAETKVASANLPHHGALPPQKPQPAVEASEEAETSGTVSGAMVHVRSGPGTQFSVLTTLKQGDAVKIETTESGWLTIAWPDSAPLWIAKEGVQLKGAGAGREGTLKGAGALRNSASNKAETVTKLDGGTKLAILEEHNGWLKVKAPPSVHAFISAKYVSTESKKAAAKTAAEPVAAASAVKPAPEKALPPAPKETAKSKPAPVAAEKKIDVAETAKPSPGPTAPVFEAPAETAAAVAPKPQPAAKPAHGSVDEPRPAKPMPVTLSSRATLPEPLSSAQPRPVAKPAVRAPKVEGPEILIAEPPKKSVYLPPPAPAGDFSEAPTPAPAPETASAVAAAHKQIPEPPPTIAVRPTAPAPVTTTVSAAAALHSGSGAVHLNDQTFNPTVGNNGLALVDFNATWCGPCRSMSPVVESVAREMGSDAMIAKLDVDEAPQTAAKFGVNRIPCLIVFKDGHEIERHYGVHEAEDLKSWLRNNR